MFNFALFLLLTVVVAVKGQFVRTSDCDPLVPDQCLFPYPNDFYLRDDANTDTGKKVWYGLDTVILIYIYTYIYIYYILINIYYSSQKIDKDVELILMNGNF